MRKVILAFIVISQMCRAAQAPALAQTGVIINGSSDGASHVSQQTAAFGSSTTTGNTIIAYAGWTGSNAGTGCSDTQGNSYTIIVQKQNGTFNSLICQAQGITGSASNQVTVTVASTGGSYFSVWAEEWTVIRPNASADQTITGNIAASSTSASVSLTTNQPGELMVEVNYLSGGSGGYTQGSGWTIGTQVLGTEWKLAGAKGSQTCNITWVTGQSGAIVCAGFIPRPINAMPVTR